MARLTTTTSGRAALAAVATLAAAAAAAATSLPAAAATSTACSTVNFRGFPMGAPTTRGNPGAGLPRWAMTVTKPRDRRGDVSAAADTANPPSGDGDLADLCTPSRDPPCRPLGMVAVAVEEGIEAFRGRCDAACRGRPRSAAACVAACQPDDDGSGATFSVTWAGAVAVNYVRMLDVDAGEVVTVTTGVGPEGRAVGPGDDLNLVRVQMGGTAVAAGTPLTITCSGSCALVDVGFCGAAGASASPPPPPPPPTPTPVAAAAPKAATRKPIVLAPLELGVLPRTATRTSTRAFPVGSGTPFEDLFLLSDVTGSMGSAIVTVRDELPKLVAARSAVSGSVHFGVGSYLDEEDPNDGWILNQRVTGNLTAVRRAVAALKANGGGDAPEANLVALYRLATLPPAAIGWRDGARRVVTWFGDQPGHEPSCIDGGRTRLTRELVAERLRSAFITVVAVGLAGGLDETTYNYGTCAGGVGTGGGGGTAAQPWRPGQGSYIARATGGLTLSLGASSSDLIVDTLAAVDALDVQLSAVTTGCDGVFSVAFDPPLPRTVKPGSTVTIKQTITVDGGVCEALSRPDQPFSCTVDYRASGGSFASQKVASQAITGC